MARKASDYQNKARGMLAGLAIGDALGAPYEFGYKSEGILKLGDKISHFHAQTKNFKLPKGAWTDDTSMALCIADSLLEKGGYDSYDIMDKFTKWFLYGYRSSVDHSVGIGQQTSLCLLMYGRHKTIPKGTRNTNRAGNGPIMRLAPIVIASTKKDGGQPQSVDHLVHLAQLSCRETHDSYMAIAATTVFAGALDYALHYGFVDEHIFRYVPDLYPEDRNEYIGRLLESTQCSNDKSGESLKDHGGYVVDALTIALWGIRNHNNFKDGMLAVIRLGGDTDTNAACYGQLAGALYGYEAIPEEWRDGVHLSNELVDIADRLLNMDECPIIRTRFEDDSHFMAL